MKSFNATLWKMADEVFVVEQTCCSTYFSVKERDLLDNVQIRQGEWRIGRAPDCLVGHACFPGSNPADPVWVFQRNIHVSPLSILLGNQVELMLKAMYRR